MLPVFLAGRRHPGLSLSFLLFRVSYLRGKCCPFIWQGIGIWALVLFVVSVFHGLLGSRLMLFGSFLGRLFFLVGGGGDGFRGVFQRVVFIAWMIL